MPAGKYEECDECHLLLGRKKAMHMCPRTKTIKRLKEIIFTLTDQLVSALGARREPMPEVEQMELEFGTDGVIRTVYRDGIEKFAEDIGAEVRTVCRAAHVEWETINGESGWTIRAAHDPSLHIRDVGSSEPVLICTRDTSHGRVCLCVERKTAMEIEQSFFFKLLPPKEVR